jgi:hypothetical protein
MPDGAHFLFLKAVSEGNMIVVTNWRSVVRSHMTGTPAR